MSWYRSYDLVYRLSITQEEKKGREKERQEYDTSDHHGNYKIIMG